MTAISKSDSIRKISSPYLYHFTRTIDAIIGILSDKKFKPSICKERYPYIKKEFIRDIPMVCFCDIPQNARKKHKERYGYYAIAMSKEWARNKKISPVIYLRNQSYLTESIKSIFNNPLITSDVKNQLLNYCKPTLGFEYVKKCDAWSSNRVRFYDEREWRFAPVKTSELFFEDKDIIAVYVKDKNDIDKISHLIDRDKIHITSKK